MSKEFASYELALALKELGFDEPCFGYFNGTTVTRMSDKGTLSINEIQTWRNTFLSYDGGKNVIPNEDAFKQDLIDNPEKYSRHKWGITVSAPLYQQAFKFVLGIIENDSKLERKFMDRYFLDFSSEGFQMDDRELSTTYESDEETLANIINFIILNK